MTITTHAAYRTDDPDFALRARISRMTTAALDALVGDDDDHIAQLAMDELDKRISAAKDSRVAQGTGCAVGEQPS